MHELFAWWTYQQWLAVLRIGVGLWWLESVRHKDLRGFVRGGSMDWVESLTEKHPIPMFARLIKATALRSPRSRVAASCLVLAGEFCTGVSLTLGLLLPAGAIVGIFLNLNYLLLAGVRDQGEQGQNLMMILSEVVILATLGGGVWSLDRLIFH